MAQELISLDGLKNLARMVKGDENICIGIRPFGFHAGNMSAIVVYPILLCEELEKLGKRPEFNFICSLNDYEQHEIIGHDCDPDEDDEANIYPKGKTLQYEPAFPDGKSSFVDYWEPIIRRNLELIMERYPAVSIKLIRMSDLKETSLFYKTLDVSLRHPTEIAKILENTTGRHVHLPAEFSRVVCSECEVPVPKTEISGDIISASCGCGNKINGPFTGFDYWMNHNLLGITKFPKKFDFFVWMLGYDHKQFHSGDIKEKIIHDFNLAACDCHRIYAPLLLREDGNKMGKSNGNVGYVHIDKLLEILRTVRGDSFVVPDSALSSSMDEVALHAG